MKKLYTNVELLTTPVENEHLVNKKYVDDAISRKVKDPVRVVSASDVDLTSAVVLPMKIDEVEIAKDDRVLLIGQTDASENGIYVLTEDDNGDLKFVRADDFDDQEDVFLNMMIPVREGKNNADVTYVLTNDALPTLGTNVLTFAKFKGQDYVTSFTTDFAGDGTEKDFEIEHNLGTESVEVVIKDKNTSEICMFDVTVLSENKINIHADIVLDTTDEFTVVVMG